MANRDGHIRVLPLHVANKIAAGEVVERPASVAKELIENALDAGAKNIKIAIVRGGRKLVAVQDDGCGMTRDDAVLCLERQATSKIADVDDIERIDTLGFRGEAIPSIASVSRFTITTRRADSDEGTEVVVNCGTLLNVNAIGCPPGTRVEVRDLFCNVPARLKFLRAYATEENHVKTIFTSQAIANPKVGFTLHMDEREAYRLAPADDLRTRINDLFGEDFLYSMLPIDSTEGDIKITGFIEKPNLATPTRRDQYIFVNRRAASAPAIAYAVREAYPRHQGDARPAAIINIDLQAGMVDVNVHPTKREVRFRDTSSIKAAITIAIENALKKQSVPQPTPVIAEIASVVHTPSPTPTPSPSPLPFTSPIPTPAPTQMELPLAADEDRLQPWNWFKFLAVTESGYLLIETDSGIVTINPYAARERITFEQLQREVVSQPLLLPDVIKMSPPDFARVKSALEVINSLGFKLEPFGTDTWKIDAVPQIIGELSPTAILQTIARDLADGTRRTGERWKEDLIAKSVARSFAGAKLHLDGDSATKLVESLAACRMPYVCPRGKPIMIFTSNRELGRKFSRT